VIRMPIRKRRGRVHHLAECSGGSLVLLDLSRRYDPQKMLRLADRPCVAAQVLQAPVSSREVEVRRKHLKAGLHRLRDPYTRELLARLPSWKKNAFLQSQRFIDRFALQLIRNDEADQIRDHQWHDDGVVSGHL